MSSLLEVIWLLVWSSVSVNSPQLRASAPMVASSHPQFLTDTRGAPCKWDPELSGPHAKSITGWSPVCHQGAVLQLPRGQVHDLRRGSSPPAVCQLPSQPVRVHHFLAPQHSQAWSQRRDFAFQKAHGSTVRLWLSDLPVRGYCTAPWLAVGEESRIPGTTTFTDLLWQSGSIMRSRTQVGVSNARFHSQKLRLLLIRR